MGKSGNQEGRDYYWQTAVELFTAKFPYFTSKSATNILKKSPGSVTSNCPISTRSSTSSKKNDTSTSTNSGAGAGLGIFRVATGATPGAAAAAAVCCVF
jgi:hypothetical protein